MITTGKITLAKVAQETGFSRATIYAVLNENNNSNIGVSEATKTKVKEAINKLGYIPNNAAKTLASGKSYTIGLLLVDATAAFENKICNAFNYYWKKHNYTIIPDFHNSDSNIEKEKIQNFLALGVDAIVISRTSPSNNSKELMRFRKLNKPVIILGNELDNDVFCFVSFNELGAMQQITRYLNEKKLSQIAYIGNKKIQWSSLIRRNNLKYAMTKYPELRLLSESDVESYDELLSQVRDLTTQNKQVEAIICYNDRVALSLIHCCRELGVEIPKELQIIGFDNDEDQFSPINFTSIEFPINDLAEATYRCFEQNLNNSTSQIINLSTKLIIK